MQSRLTVRLLGVFIFAFLLTGLATFLLSRTDDTELPTDSLLGYIDFITPKIVLRPNGEFTVADLTLYDEKAYILRRPDGSEIERGGNKDTLAAIETLSAARSVTTMPTGSYTLTWLIDKKTEDNIYLISVPLVVQGRPLILEFADIDTPTDSGLYALAYEWLGEFVPVGVPLLLVLVVALTLSLRSALRPLEHLRRLAARIGPQQTGLRLPTDDLPSELQSPVLAINRALDRLDHGFQAQRDFLADAAHELRTPLAILSAHLDTLPRSQGSDGQGTDALKSDVERMTRLVNQLLLVAQLESLTIDASETADLSDIAIDLAALFAPLAIRRQRSVGVSGAEQPVIVRGNRDAIHQALRNLVENALRFTPPGTEVEITVDQDGGVSVSDHGPGVPADEREVLFRRFWQGKRRRPRDSQGRDSSSSGGAGLGLAIAQRLAETHGGSLRIGDNPGGGARFTLMLRKVSGKPTPLSLAAPMPLG
ncbi:sensor histidine kinase [Dongia rigui]|uniref:histidine kinase n=1 Tax=Dongia rigui TaxID=940149 RepID=A0ABU5DZL1_9PROT|nr:HAMP domain-containing sensor histidine kinase [Dongia rigui]MDY0871981.1 HAMP domain-containing sensor histidine kinase [Dongia rigui]